MGWDLGCPDGMPKEKRQVQRSCGRCGPGRLACREQEGDARYNLRLKMNVGTKPGLTWIDHRKDIGLKKKKSP